MSKSTKSLADLSGRVLITGGAGFIGSSIVDHLKNFRMDIVVADSRRRLERSEFLSAGNVTVVDCEWPDVPDFDSLGKFDYIIHLAWSTNPASSMGCISEDASTNILGTIGLLENLVKMPKSRLIFFSSGGTVYGNTNGGAITELEPTNPISAYGISKLACEKYINLYSRLKNTSSVILRLGNPYGAYQLKGTPVGAISSFVNKISNNNTIQVYGDGENVRDFIHIDDVCRAVISCMAIKEAEGVYNLGSGVGFSINNLLEIISETLTFPIKVEYLPDRRVDVREVVLDVGKIKSQLNFECLIPLDEGVKQMIVAAGLGSYDQRKIANAT